MAHQCPLGVKGLYGLPCDAVLVNKLVIAFNFQNISMHAVYFESLFIVIKFKTLIMSKKKLDLSFTE